MSDKHAGGADSLVVVYRVVDAIELAYLEAHADYGSNPSKSGKYFALTLDGAQAFAGAAVNQFSTITRTALPASILGQGILFNDPGPFGAGVSVFFSEGQLAEVYGTMSPPVVWKGVPR